MQPDAHFVIILRCLNGDLELFCRDALEREERIVEWAIIMVLAQRPRQTGAAFIDRAADNRESSKAFAWTARRLFV